MSERHDRDAVRRPSPAAICYPRARETH